MKVADYIDGCFVEIYDKAVKNEAETDSQGVPVFDNVPYVRIKPTNSKDVYDQPLNGDKKLKYAALYSRYEAGDEATPSGWPVEEFAQLDATQVATLKSAGILTVQALADITEHGFSRLPSGYIALKQKAQDALSQRNSAEQIRAEFDQLSKAYEERFSAMQEQILELTEEIVRVEGKIPKKPGRPPKVPKEEEVTT